MAEAAFQTHKNQTVRHFVAPGSARMSQTGHTGASRKEAVRKHDALQ